jgi:diguanylate cyclase (GGDEF)-like protein
MTSSSLKRILMVEDEPDIQAIARLALESIGGFAVRICGSGAEAIEAGPAFDPDLILLDVMMPAMDGPTTLKALRRLPKLASTPVLFMTAKVQPHELAQYRHLGVVDIVPKPFDPLTLATTISTIWQRQPPASPPANSLAKFQAIADSYAASLPEKLAQIERAWEVAIQTWASQDLAALRKLAHGLHGSGATLGFAQMGDAAARLDRYLGQLSGGPDMHRAEITRLIAVLRAAVTAPQRAIEHGDQQRALITVSAPADLALNHHRLLFAVGLAPALADDLASQLGHFGYRMEQIAAAGLPRLAASRRPAAILTPAAKGDDEPSIIAIARETWAAVPPIICLSERGDFDTRLRAVRSGVDAFFTLPVNTIALIDWLDTMTAIGPPDPYRILIVEDEVDLANYHAAKLVEAGMRVEVVTNALQVMAPLVDFRPDLVLMDMYMPGCDGMDLAAVIRQQGDFIGIPIVFLSAETNRDMQLEAMRLGGDDFMTKPILPDHLITAIDSRVKRSRMVRSVMVRDSLTGLFNHTTTKEYLELELARANRNQLPLSFAIIDIDHFKSINDSYGHPAGDRVLKSVSRLLQQRLRRSDVIGRYGGEEFAVVLAGADGPTAFRVLDQIRLGLTQVRQQARDEAFTVTFSCGIASFPGYADGPALTSAADRALYDAKRDGRNRVVLAQ